MKTSHLLSILTASISISNSMISQYIHNAVNLSILYSNIKIFKLVKREVGEATYSITMATG